MLLISQAHLRCLLAANETSYCRRKKQTQQLFICSHPNPHSSDETLLAHSATVKTSAKTTLPDIILEQINPKAACQALQLCPRKVLRRRRTNGMNKKMGGKKWRTDTGEIESAGHCKVSKQRGYVRRVPQAFFSYKRSQ